MAARLAKKLTQAQLAQMINEKPQVIQEYESGKAIPSRRSCRSFRARWAPHSAPRRPQLLLRSRAVQAWKLGCCAGSGSESLAFLSCTPAMFILYALPFARGTAETSV